MRNLEDIAAGFVFAGLIYFVLVLIFVVLSFSARAEVVQIPLSFTDFVNVTASNSTLQVTADNVTYTYSLSNSSQTLVFPVLVNESRPLLNVSVEGQDCGESFNESLNNQTAYFERLVREQLVPSQQQYHDLEMEKLNLSAQCVVEKNVLSNEILNHKVLLNASFINYNATTSLLLTKLDNERSEKSTSNIVAVMLAVLVFVLALVIITGQLPPEWWTRFIHQMPGGAARGSLKVGKVKGGQK